jgi:hypothetical protein
MRARTTVRLEDGKSLVDVADEAHRPFLDAVFEQVRGNYDHRLDVQLFNAGVRTLEKEGYTFISVIEKPDPPAPPTTRQRSSPRDRVRWGRSRGKRDGWPCPGLVPPSSHARQRCFRPQASRIGDLSTHSVAALDDQR